ncbi:MAG: chlorophyll synthase ChlG [Pseudomonadota bacterium]
MSNVDVSLSSRSFPSLGAIVELSKPVTWFAPMWAFACGVVSAGQPLADRWPYFIGGVLLAGPLVCATSQAVNDWYDRHVDALNEPNRPIPSGRIPGRWGLYLAIVWTVASVILAAFLGVWTLAAAIVGLILAWAYSAPPARLKLNGWWGNAACGFSYEGIAWFTGAAVMLGTLPSVPIIFAAVFYSIGAHGIMTLNDFKAIEGDREMGVNSLPVQLGPDRAARLACMVMIGAQLPVIGLLIAMNAYAHAAVVGSLVAVQGRLMFPLLADPRGRAPWYNATGTSLYVLGMLVTAFAIGAAQEGASLG